MTQRMTPPLRLVEPPPRDADDAGFAPVDRDPHDLHPPYRDLAVIEDDAAADDDVTVRPALSPRFVVAALIVFQALAASTFLGKYAALARGGEDQFRFAAAMSVAASACLYAGAGLLALRPGRGRVLFVAAACGFALSLPGWGIGYGWSWPMAFGAMVALAGAWFARPEVRPDADSAAQP